MIPQHLETIRQQFLAAKASDDPTQMREFFTRYPNEQLLELKTALAEAKKVKDEDAERVRRKEDKQVKARQALQLVWKRQMLNYSQTVKDNRESEKERLKVKYPGLDETQLRSVTNNPGKAKARYAS